jgi:dUTP pyrophosphatase
MVNSRHVDEFFEKCKEVFFARHSSYGTKGMSYNKALPLLSTKVDRLLNGQASEDQIKDTLIDAANYSLIAFLDRSGQWKDTETAPGGSDATETPSRDKETPTEKPVILMKRDERAKEFPLPTPAIKQDVGFDLFTSEDTIIPARNEKPIPVPTGVAVKLPEGYWCDVRSRSSSNKRGIVVVSCVIDPLYTGELYGMALNTTNEDIVVKRGERISQFVLHKANYADVMEVETLPETTRGSKGFGSSGR